MILQEIFEKVYYQCNKQKVLREMSLIGFSNDKKNAFYTYSRKYSSEVPHINYGRPGNASPIAKIEIPPELPTSIDDFEILRYKKKYVTPNKKFKQEIFEWFISMNKNNLAKTNWESSMDAWKMSVEAKSYGML